METELDVVNEALASTGLAAVGSIDSKHPAFLKAHTVFNRVLQRIQNRGYWFNTSVRYLVPDVNGEIVIPQFAAVVDVIGDAKAIITVRGTKLFNIDERTYTIGEQQLCRIIERLAFADLPVVVREYVSARTVYEYYLEEDGAEPKLSSYASRLSIAYAMLDAEDIRHNEYNALESTHMLMTKFPGLSSRRAR